MWVKFHSSNKKNADHEKKREEIQVEVESTVLVLMLGYKKHII